VSSKFLREVAMLSQKQWVAVLLACLLQGCGPVSFDDFDDEVLLEGATREQFVSKMGDQVFMPLAATSISALIRSCVDECAVVACMTVPMEAVDGAVKQLQRGQGQPPKHQLLKSSQPGISDALAKTFNSPDRWPSWWQAVADDGRYHVVHSSIRESREAIWLYDPQRESLAIWHVVWTGQ
jgi:acyl-CoA synthetase (AMP-forming)/AMP-acid ligase II